MEDVAEIVGIPGEVTLNLAIGAMGGDAPVGVRRLFRRIDWVGCAEILSNLRRGRNTTGSEGASEGSRSESRSLIL